MFNVQQHLYLDCHGNIHRATQKWLELNINLLFKCAEEKELRISVH